MCWGAQTPNQPSSYPVRSTAKQQKQPVTEQGITTIFKQGTLDTKLIHLPNLMDVCFFWTTLICHVSSFDGPMGQTMSHHRYFFGRHWSVLEISAGDMSPFSPV